MGKTAVKIQAIETERTIMQCCDAIRVLLIDVSSGYVKNLEPKLQAAGLQTFLAEKCSELLSQARKGHFDAVIVDAELSQVDQTDLPQIIRHVNCARYLPIVWITADANPTVTGAALELGIDVILSQSTPLPVILSYILALVRNKRRSDELLDTIGRLRNQLVQQTQRVNQLKCDNVELREQSTRDPLTKTHNAGYMHQWLTQAFAYASRYRKPLTVMLIDIDHFKWVNDCYGHLTGDETLKNLARIVRNSVRDSDLVARYGGDEFLIALPSSASDAVSALANRILADLKESPIGTGDDAYVLTCSIGSATYPSDSPIETCHDLIMLADQAMYAAKRAGRGRLAQWSELSETHRQAIEARPETSAVTRSSTPCPVCS